MTRKPTRQRKGGLRQDPEVEQWLATAADNPASLTKKQRQDRQRVRVRYDVPQWLKDAIHKIAQDNTTSDSQAGALLLAYAVRKYFDNDTELVDAFFANCEPSNTLRFDTNIAIPHQFEVHL